MNYVAVRYVSSTKKDFINKPPKDNISLCLPIWWAFFFLCFIHMTLNIIKRYIVGDKY